MCSSHLSSVHTSFCVYSIWIQKIEVTVWTYGCVGVCIFFVCALICVNGARTQKGSSRFINRYGKMRSIAVWFIRQTVCSSQQINQLSQQWQLKFNWTRKMLIEFGWLFLCWRGESERDRERKKNCRWTHSANKKPNDIVSKRVKTWLWKVLALCFNISPDPN